MTQPQRSDPLEEFYQAQEIAYAKAKGTRVEMKATMPDGKVYAIGVDLKGDERDDELALKALGQSIHMCLAFGEQDGQDHAG